MAVTKIASNTTYDAITLKKDGERTDHQTNADNNTMTVHGVESVGDVVITLVHPLLYRLNKMSGNPYPNLSGGAIALTGFKLESTFLTASGMMDNSKIIPLLNGDTMTLTNANKSGQLTIACTRTAAGINGGDIIAIADFLRTQGDSYGGTLYVDWVLNGLSREIAFEKVTVARCPPITLAGNDLPDLQVVFNYARYSDGDYPAIT